jgi:hypothetical protein
LLRVRDRNSFMTAIGYERISLRAINVYVRYKYEVNDRGLEVGLEMGRAKPDLCQETPRMRAVCVYHARLYG